MDFHQKRKSKGWLNGAIVGFIYMLILYLVSSIVYREFAINSYVLILLGIGILSGSIGGILGINLKDNKDSKVKI